MPLIFGVFANVFESLCPFWRSLSSTWALVFLLVCFIAITIFSEMIAPMVITSFGLRTGGCQSGSPFILNNMVLFMYVIVIPGFIILDKAGAFLRAIFCSDKNSQQVAEPDRKHVAQGGE